MSQLNWHHLAPRLDPVLETPDLDNFWSADIETTGLLHMLVKQEKPRLHNLGLKRTKDGMEVLYSQGANALAPLPNVEIRPIEDLQAFFDTNPVLVMHNGACYDGEALAFFGYNLRSTRIIDTLYLAWYLEPLRVRYGLAEYGEEFGVPKPPVEDWINLPQEEYNRRVMQDARIQHSLWKRLWGMASKLYDGVIPDVWRAISHVSIVKARPLRNQQRTRWKLDIPAAKEARDEWAQEKEERGEELAAVLPRKPVWKAKKRPARMYKGNGQLSAYGVAWLDFCCTYGITDTDPDLEVSYIDGDVAGNPNAPQQVKDWLFSLGWEPETFEYKRNDDGSERKIPQINVKDSGGKLDPDINRLAEDYPEVRALQGLGIIKHRLGLVENWIANEQDGTLAARAAGFTNTLRLRHAEIVNIPSTRVTHGEKLRSLLTAFDPDESGDEMELLGSDLSSLEDRCKHHYQIPLDPEYVKAQMTKGFDPHVTIAVMGDFCTQDDYDFYVGVDLGLIEKTPEVEERVAKIKLVRNLGKRTNYGCQYGARPPRLARDAKIPLETAQRLFDAYWSLNWSINEIARSTEVKSCNGANWQYNPVAKLWYHLKTEKDRFSTLCQGTGAFVFDMWVNELFELCLERWNREPMMNGQFHDEIILSTKKKHRELWRGVVLEALDRANKILNMRRTIECGIDFGIDYSHIH
ncbi:DNA polymerase [Shewanella phage SppYZU05]|uniref:DNA polymerase n=1 Tax=Shewanella phage SppYZU05 TaxID=1970795 RepID=A0A1W6JTI2_9CAUD|nr:DNA polymerase [Shewanella phage SppYZU05]ARM70560.1 DNA polymerase [Shewanella phage SppYZU05]